jgi:putative transposase
MSKPETLSVVKLPLKPDEANAFVLDGQSRICNWCYNHLLELAQENKTRFIETGDELSAKIVYTKRGLRNLLPKIKEEHNFLKVVHSSPLKNAALRVSQAIQEHQKSKKGNRKGARVGWPQFRCWKTDWFSLLYDEPNKGYKIEKDMLILSLGLGEDCKQRSVTIPIEDTYALKDKTIRNLRITKEGDTYFAIFTVKIEIPNKKYISKICALDPNHKNLAYSCDVDGKAIEIASPTWLKNYDRRLDELKSKRDRCVKKSVKKPVLDASGSPTGKEYWEPSRRWKKYNNTYQGVLKKRREQTKTFLYTTAHRLFQKYDCVGIGNYTPHGNGITTKMRRAMNNRSLIGRFKQVLSWVALKSGKVFLEYNEKGTTQTCRYCGHVVQGGIAPQIRSWQCPTCQAMHIRGRECRDQWLEASLARLGHKK